MNFEKKIGILNAKFQMRWRYLAQTKNLSGSRVFIRMKPVKKIFIDLRLEERYVYSSDGIEKGLFGGLELGTEFKRLKIRKNSIKISRRIIQILAFLLINYVILETILPINLISFEGIVKVLPILNSPRNPLSNGAGILEYIFFSMGEGAFPFFLLAILILVLLFTNRVFCGWICPIGSIQDLCAAVPTKKKKI